LCHRQAIEIQPDYHPAWQYQLGKELTQIGDTEGALAAYDRKRSNFTPCRSRDTWYGLAISFWQLGQLPDAFAYALSPSFQPSRVEAWYRQGKASNSCRKWERSAI
jgi:tetratricopeptide (TPR) repeat protein